MPKKSKKSKKKSHKQTPKLIEFNKIKLFYSLIILTLVLLLLQLYLIQYKKNQDNDNRLRTLPIIKKESIPELQQAYQTKPKRANLPKAILAGAEGCGTELIQNYLLHGGIFCRKSGK